MTIKRATHLKNPARFKFNDRVSVPLLEISGTIVAWQISFDNVGADPGDMYKYDIRDADDKVHRYVVQSNIEKVESTEEPELQAVA